jgi:hypothetical protein
VGPQQGRKVFTLRTLPERDPYESSTSTVGKVAGFSLHAGVAAKAQQRDKLERLCRYITRPAVSEKRLSLTTQGKVRYELKTSYRDGTIDVIFEPLGFIARLAALVPKPRVNLTRFHGVFVPNNNYRVQVTSARRDKGSKPKAPEQAQDRTPAERRAAMTWAQRLKWVFRIEIEICQHSGAPVLQIFQESRRSNASFHVYRRSASGRSRPMGRIREAASHRRSKIDPELPFGKDL